MRRFWNWTQPSDGGERVLRLEGVIAEESWYGDEATPAAFREELFAEEGNITLWLRSPGGDCFAASQIYTMLMEYPDDVTVKIDSLAASAASVIAMAGTKILMSPTATMMIHNPLTVAIGDSEEMRKAGQMLSEIKETLITAYEIKTGLPRAKIGAMMDAESWLGSGKAVELGFADGILYQGEAKTEKTGGAGVEASFVFSRMMPVNALLDKLRPTTPKAPGTPAADLDKRLALLK